MLSYSLGYSRVSRQTDGQMMDGRWEGNSINCFCLKRQASSHGLTSRSQRDNIYQLSRTNGIALSERNKQNHPHRDKDFSILTNTKFTKKPSSSKRPLLISNQQSLLTEHKDSFNFQRICLTESSPSVRSHRDTMRSSSKRKKKTQHLFNFTTRHTTKPKDNPNKDVYIQSFLSSNKQQFISTNNSQISNSQTLNNDRQSYQQDRSVKTYICPDVKLKQNNYQKIRQKMKKLKNMTEVRTFKRKPLKYKTTEEEWNEIQKLVRMVCKEEMKRVDTQETLQTQLQGSRGNINQLQMRDDHDEEVKNYVQMRDDHEEVKHFEEEKRISRQVRDNQQWLEEVLDKDIKGPELKQQFTCRQNKQDCRHRESKALNQAKTENISNNTQCSKIQQSQNISLQPQQQPKPLILSVIKQSTSPITYPQFFALLLIYEHTLYMLPSTVNKISQICKQFELQYKLPIFMFFKQMCLSKKLIEAIFDQQEENFFAKQGLYDYSDVVKQIRRANANNVKSLVVFKPDTNTGKNKQTKLLNKHSLELLTAKQSIQELNCHISTIKNDFFFTNIKLIKKLLKCISNSPDTSAKHLQSFLNYTSCFLNLMTIPKIIKQVLASEITLPTPLQNPSPEKQQAQVKEFLYEECQFVENKYLTMKEKVFEMCFDIHQENKKIQKYYHKLIKELKAKEEQEKTVRK